jgi:predicted dehydrogenase
MSSTPLTCVIVGAGNRSMRYAEYALQEPEKFKIVAVVEPLEFRRRQAMKIHNIDESMAFTSVEELCAKGKLADTAINGTMDQLHIPTSVPLLEAGYDILLEKPLAVSEEEMMHLLRVMRKNKRTILICHVLRYAPFYAAIRRKIIEGRLGTIMNIQTNEHVSYHHEVSAFVRGKWNRKDVCGSDHLMSKCCHDLDLIMWMLSGNAPTTVASFGSRMFFREDKAPEGSGTRCLVDCSIERDCPYSAKRMYVENRLWETYAWEDVEEYDDKSEKFRVDHLKKDSPFGRCVWRCDNNIVDHQSVLIRFANGATGTHNLVTGTAKGLRSIHILGSRGDLYGVFDQSQFEIRTPNPSAPGHYESEVIDLNVTGDFHGLHGGHGGGDSRLVADFVDLLSGGEPSISCTSLEDSIYGHLVGFRAEVAREKDTVVPVSIDL